MTVPNLTESENEDLIDRFHAFQDIPPSQKTVDVWREYFEIVAVINVQNITNLNFAKSL